MLDLSQIQLKKPEKHQLKNQGCKCQMCQKINHQQTMRIVVQNIIDHQSQSYGEGTKEYYLKVIYKMADWDKKPRKLRFALPQICIYQNSQPIQLINKRKQNYPIKIIRDKSKMHMFQIIHYFLQGFVYHNPEPIKKTKRGKSTSFSTSGYNQKYKNQCIVIAKYKNNIYNMLTLNQMEGLFKSRQKYLRDGLLYLQTLVCTKDYNEIRVNLILKDHLQSDLYQRARKQIKILHQQLKSSDLDYFSQQQQIAFQASLRQKSLRSFLEYLSLKIVLGLSKNQSNTISQAVFKFVHNKDVCYLIDVRVKKIQPSQLFWATAAMKAFQYRLSKRMSMMDIGADKEKEKEKVKNRYMGKKAQNLSVWLEKSTEAQWDEMKIIKTRLQRLQKQKKSLMESQSAIEGQMSTNKSFKIRSFYKH